MSRVSLYSLMMLHVLFSSGTYIFGKNAAVAFSNPVTVTSYRACGAMFVFLLLSGKFIPKPTFSLKEWGVIVLLGVLLVPMNQYCFLYGMQYTVPSHPAIFYALTPMGVLLISSVIERKIPKLLTIFAIGLSFAGVIVILRPWQSGADIGELRAGDIWILGAVLSWMFYTVAAKNICRKHSTITVTSWSLIAGAIFMVPFFINSFFHVNFSSVPLKAWFSLIWLILITSVTMMLLWNILLKHLDPVKVAISTNLQPPMTVILAVLVSLTGFLENNQDTGIIFFSGMILILTGVTLLQFCRK